MERSDTAAVVEIEIDNELNRSLIFQPANRRIRGRFDLSRIKEPLAMMQHEKWPQPVPGQRLRVNLTTGHGHLIEPLRFDEHQALREKVEKSGFQVAQENEDLGQVDVTTWVFWMHRAVQSGHARLTAGSWPELTGKPRKNFHFEPSPPRDDKVAQAMNGFANALREQTAVLTELLKRK